jgi:hypothetical protein
MEICKADPRVYINLSFGFCTVCSFSISSQTCGPKVGVLRASHKIFLSLTGKFEWKFSRFYLCTAQTFHANSPVRLKKSLWDSRTTATLDPQEFRRHAPNWMRNRDSLKKFGKKNFTENFHIFFFFENVVSGNLQSRSASIY